MAAAGLIVGAAVGGSASAQTVIMATDKIGSLMNATGAGLAKVITQHAPGRAVVRAFAGPDAYLPAMDRGEFAFTAISAVAAWSHYNGKTTRGKPLTNLRLLRAGASALRLTILVSAKSDIRTYQDLKGRRVAAGYGGHTTVVRAIGGALKAAGLDWDKVDKVPVTGVVDGIRALAAGRVDGSWAAFGMPVVRELHAKSGVRYLSLDGSAETLATLRREIFPGSQLIKVKAIPRMGLPEDGYFVGSESYLVTHKDADPKVVRAALAALWDNTEQLRKIHFALRGFTHEAAATTLPMLPFHPAAIAFYREKGVWTDKAAAAHAAFE